MNKKIIITILSIAFCLSLGCSNKNENQTAPNTKQTRSSAVYQNENKTIKPSTQNNEMGEVFFGQWKIKNEIAFGPVETYSSGRY
jgi:uncharacterized lipoprotein NlpE involved in copper resistance